MGLAHPCSLYGDRDHGPALVISHAHLVAPLAQARKERGVHLSSGGVPSPDGDVGSIPMGALSPNLYFQTNQSRWCVHDRGTEVAANVEHDGPYFARPGEMVHDYGATETGVADGFL